MAYWRFARLPNPEQDPDGARALREGLRHRGRAGDQDVFRVVQPVARLLISTRTRSFPPRGQRATTLELACSRCLEPHTMEVAPSFDLRYQLPHGEYWRSEREIEEDDLDDGVLRERDDRPRTADARAVLTWCYR